MESRCTSIPEVQVISPKVFGDERGYFLETFRQDAYQQIGITDDFVQDNQSFSRKGVLRGIHYQIHQTQGKLVQVTYGKVFDVAVDLRRKSPTFGRWVGQELSDKNHLQLWLPTGFGHGFLVLSEEAIFQYKTTDYYAPQWERTIRWNDPQLNIEWPLLDVPFTISGKDQNALYFSEAEVFEGVEGS
jgi:dTDP-4-dehydrorhamnose 3,5-epimerase